MRAVALGICRLLGIMFLASFLAAILIRIAPGFGSDEQELNSSLSSRSIQAIRQAHLTNAEIPRYYAHYIASLARGDLGVSQSLNQPVSLLLRERLPVTLRNIGVALSLAWLLGLSLAVVGQLARSSAITGTAEVLSGALISTPAAVLALLGVLLRMPPLVAAILLVFPKIYRYVCNLLRESYSYPHVLMARAKGAGEWRILAWHVAPVVLPQMLALMGVSISIVIGVLLPVEAICDVPGIGQLAWMAAESRDLPLLVNLTLCIAFVTVFATMLSDAVRARFTRRTA